MKVTHCACTCSVAPEDRDRVYNVISLEFSQTVMCNDVVPPLVARQLDMLELVWPSDAASDRPQASEAHPSSTRFANACLSVQVQRYCLMGPQGAYTDFHVDLGGTSVWYHVVKGCKVLSYKTYPWSRPL